MKRILLHHHALIVTFVTMLLLLAGSSASAQTTYGLEVAGVEVTSDNYKDLSVIDGVTGTVNYNPYLQTLTLIDATIDGGEYEGIVAQDYITCVVKGTVTVTSTYKSALVFYQGATIEGRGKLIAKNEEDVTIFSKYQLIIDGCTIEAEGGESAIAGVATAHSHLTEKLIVRNASVTLRSNSYTICDISKFALEGCKITKPTGAVWNEAKRALCDAWGNPITGEVVITPTATMYGLKIADVEVTSSNYKNLSDFEGVTGKVSYDPATKTLTLENASINLEGPKNGIVAYNDLTCVVKGNVSISSDFVPMVFYGKTTIQGDGRLTLKSPDPNSCAIYLTAFSSLLIDGCTVDAYSRGGITGSIGISTETLTIRNAHVTVKVLQSTEGIKGTIWGITSLTLERCGITKPMGAVWDDTQKAICNGSDKRFVDEVVIEPVEEYNLKIAGVEVNSANC